MRVKLNVVLVLELGSASLCPNVTATTAVEVEPLAQSQQCQGPTMDGQVCLSFHSNFSIIHIVKQYTSVCYIACEIDNVKHREYAIDAMFAIAIRIDGKWKCFGFNRCPRLDG
jgi:hypothetical protein